MSGQRGSILIIVLWWMVILSVMAIALYSAVRPRLEVAGRLRDRAAAHYAATSALYLAISLVHADATPGFDGLGEAWANNEAALAEIKIGGGIYALGSGRPLAEGPDKGEFRYGLDDEESRLNLNKAPFEALVRLFENTCDLPTMECEKLAGAVVDWRDEDDDLSESGAESVAYHELLNPYSPRNAEFQIPEELLLVKGVSPDLFHRVEPYVTVFGTGAVNINTASPTALSCLGLGSGTIEAVESFRNGPDGVLGTLDDTPFERTGDILKILDEAGLLGNLARSEIRRAVNSRLLTVRSDNFRGHLFRQLDNSPQSMHITFVFNRGGAVRYWREK